MNKEQRGRGFMNGFFPLLSPRIKLRGEEDS